MASNLLSADNEVLTIPPPVLEGSSWGKCMLLLLIGVFTGNMQEAITIGFTGGLFFYLLFNRRHVNRGSLALFLGLALGVAGIVFSPGTWHRVGDHNEVLGQSSLIVKLLRNATQEVFTIASQPLIVLGLLLLLYVLVRRRRAFTGSLLPWATVCSLAFFVIVIIPDERIFFGISTFCLVMLLSWYARFEKLVKAKALTFAAFLLCLCPGYQALATTSDYAWFHQNKERYIAQDGDECILNAKDIDSCRISKDDIRKSRYTFDWGVSKNIYNRNRMGEARYYGKKYIQVLPTFLYNQRMKPCFLEGADVVSQYKAMGNENVQIYHWEGQPYYVIPLKHRLAYDGEADVQYRTKPDDEATLKPHQRFIRELLQYKWDGTMTETAFPVIQNNTDYYVFNLPQLPERFWLSIYTENFKEKITFVKTSS